MPPVNLVLLIFAILFGLAFGSFLNVCIIRLPQGASIVTPGSKCVTCSKPIRARDNVPILSWLLLRGRCRACGSSISARYPLVEAATAALFAACFLHFSTTFEATGMAVFCWLLLGLMLMDATTFLLPDAFTLPGVVAGFIYTSVHVTEHGRGMLQALIGALAVGGCLLLIRTLYRLLRRQQGMGFGDVKLGAMIGAWLGWKLGAVALFLSIIAGAVGAFAAVSLNRSSQHADQSRGVQGLGNLRVPFGAFMAGAAIVTVFAGTPLLHWYLHFFP